MADAGGRLLLPQEIIRRKRDGEALSAVEIADFVDGVVSGAVSDAQLGAFAMAALLNGLDREETVELTRAMTRSGATLDWSGLPGPTVDKHSTGGVGDTVSLLLAPALAACGAFVPMIAGRGLGHTGGTIDKLGAIPGYRTRPDLGVLRRVVREAGCAIVGQSAEIAPADRRLYAARDVTGTVESLPLITASILSKKLAAGLAGLVMDVKCGSGAFMTGIDEARALARSLIDVASGAGLPTVALITDMDQPLAAVAGNAIETLHAIEILAGRRSDPRLLEATAALGGEALALGGLCASPGEGAARIRAALSSGAAADRFARMAAELGGPSDLVERPRVHLAAAPTTLPVVPMRRGVVTGVDTRALGLAVVSLGGGRTRAEDAVDPAVGLESLAEAGEEVGPDRPLAVVHARDRVTGDRAVETVRAAYRVTEAGGAAERRPIVLERLS